MNCTWDEPQKIEFPNATKSMHIRIYEEPETGAKPIYVCEYVSTDNWTTHEKAQGTQALAKALGHGDLQDVRVWQMEPGGEVKELEFKPLTYTTRPDRYDLPDHEFDAAVKAGKLSRDSHTTFTAGETPIPEKQQRQELGQALLSWEQRQELAFMGKAPHR